MRDRGHVAGFGAQFLERSLAFKARVRPGPGAVAEEHPSMRRAGDLLQYVEVGADGLHQRVARTDRLADLDQFGGICEGARHGTPVR